MRLLHLEFATAAAAATAATAAAAAAIATTTALHRAYLYRQIPLFCDDCHAFTLAATYVRCKNLDSR